MSKKAIIFGIILFFFAEIHGVLYRYCFNTKNDVKTNITVQKDINNNIVSVFEETINNKNTTHNQLCDAFNEHEHLNVIFDFLLKIIAFIFIVCGTFKQLTLNIFLFCRKQCLKKLN